MRERTYAVENQSLNGGASCPNPLVERDSCSFSSLVSSAPVSARVFRASKTTDDCSVTGVRSGSRMRRSLRETFQSTTPKRELSTSTIQVDFEITVAGQNSSPSTILSSSSMATALPNALTTAITTSNQQNPNLIPISSVSSTDAAAKFAAIPEPISLIELDLHSGNAVAAPAEMGSGENSMRDIFSDMRLLTCDLGGRIRFTWDTNEKTEIAGNSQQLSVTGTVDLYKLTSEASYVDCDFHTPNVAQGPLGQTLPGDGSRQFYDFDCSMIGTHMFASKGTTAGNSNLCHLYGKKLQVLVTDLSQTAALRATFNSDTGKNHFSYAKYVIDFMIDTDDNGHQGFLTNEQADLAQEALWCVTPHSTQMMNYESCKDYLPSGFLNSQPSGYCKALLETDIGFAYRKRPTPECDNALEYYDKALTLVPGICAAQSYKAGLYAQRRSRVEGGGVETITNSGTNTVTDLSLAALRTKQFQEWDSACSSCGESSMEMEILKFEYKKLGLIPPCNGGCGNYQQQLFFGNCRFRRFLRFF